MEQRTTVPRQAVLLALFSSAGALACGHRAGLLNAIALTIALILCSGFALSYRLRAALDERNETRRANDRRAGWSVALGLGVPLAIDLVLWLLRPYDGLDADAAVFVALTTTVGLAAVLVSSMVDWFWVVPRALGLIDEPIWSDDMGADRRRDLAEVWVFHRGTCELIFFVCLALAAAITIVAIGNAFHDKTISTAVESLGGAGVAFGAVEYLTPRLRGALDFALGGEVGLGTWVRHESRDLEGLVVDVSIRPGIKVVGADRRRRYVALADADKLSEAERPAAAASETWRKQVILKHFTRDPDVADAGSTTRRNVRTLRVTAIAGRALLLGFVACAVGAQSADADREPLRHTISELVHGPAGWAMTTGLACWAAAMALGAWAVLAAVAVRNRRSRAMDGVALLLAVAACGVVVLTVFPTQTVAGELPRGTAWTTTGRLHDLGSLVTQVALVAAALTSVYAFRRGDRLVMPTLGLLTIAAVAFCAGLAIGPSVGGLRQRVVLVCGLVWLWLLLSEVRRAAPPVAETDGADGGGSA